MQTSSKTLLASNPIVEKYQALHEACCKYPAIKLQTNPSGAKLQKKPTGYAKNGFVEKFCK